MGTLSARHVKRLYRKAAYPTSRCIVPAMGARGSLHTKRYKAFLKLLRAARVDAGLTQVQAAKALRRSQSWVSDSELGERRIDFVELEDLARVYGKELNWFRTRP